MLSENDQETINIFQQIFKEFFRIQNIPDYEKEYYRLECSGLNEINYTSQNVKKINSYTQCFFNTQVTLSSIRIENKDTLVFSCHFYYLDNRTVKKRCLITEPSEIKIKTKKVETLYKLYRSNAR